MKEKFSPGDLQNSVIAVPPLCRDQSRKVDAEQNKKVIQHIERGGVSTLLYGGNANFYNIALSEYEAVLDTLEAAAAPQTWIIPAVGPHFGTMMDQARMLASKNFPTAMVLPTLAASTPEGVRVAILEFVKRAGIPAVLYIKEEKYVTVEVAESLVAEGAISWIKYAVPRLSPADDPMLEALVGAIDPALVVSGIGEQPAITHWNDFGIRAFTSGCVCVAPRRSQEMLRALRAGDMGHAEDIRAHFNRLESRRNAHGPIAVLHHAVALAGIAETGPAFPLLTDLDDQTKGAIAQVARELYLWNRA